MFKNSNFLKHRDVLKNKKIQHRKETYVYSKISHLKFLTNVLKNGNFTKRQ